jgi:spermidine/putrescine-binding protein
MKKMFSQMSFVLTLVLAAGIAGALTSCQKKTELPVVTEWETYQDPTNGSEMQYPKGWLLNSDPKRTKSIRHRP